MSINFTVSYDGLVKAKSAPPPLSFNKVRTVLHFTFMFSWMYPKVYRVYWVGSTMILVIPLMGIWQNRLVNRPGGWTLKISQPNRGTRPPESTCTITITRTRTWFPYWTSGTLHLNWLFSFFLMGEFPTVIKKFGLSVPFIAIHKWQNTNTVVQKFGVRLPPWQYKCFCDSMPNANVSKKALF